MYWLGRILFSCQSTNQGEKQAGNGARRTVTLEIPWAWGGCRLLTFSSSAEASGVFCVQENIEASSLTTLSSGTWRVKLFGGDFIRSLELVGLRDKGQYWSTANMLWTGCTRGNEQWVNKQSFICFIPILALLPEHAPCKKGWGPLLYSTLLDMGIEFTEVYPYLVITRNGYWITVL